MGENDKVFYTLGKIVLLLFLGAALLYVCTGLSVLRIPIPCMLHEMTGYYCPGCGGTRSVRVLLHGDILLSLYYFPPLIPGLLLGAVFMARAFYTKHFDAAHFAKTNKHSPFALSGDGKMLKWVYIWIGLVFVQCIVKNAALLFWGYIWMK